MGLQQRSLRDHARMAGAKLPTPDAIEQAAAVVRVLAPWRDLPVRGIAVGFDDGDFAVVYDSNRADESA